MCIGWCTLFGNNSHNHSNLPLLVCTHLVLSRNHSRPIGKSCYKYGFFLHNFRTLLSLWFQEHKNLLHCISHTLPRYRCSSKFELFAHNFRKKRRLEPPLRTLLVLSRRGHPKLRLPRSCGSAARTLHRLRPPLAVLGCTPWFCSLLVLHRLCPPPHCLLGLFPPELPPLGPFLPGLLLPGLLPLGPFLPELGRSVLLHHAPQGTVLFCSLPARHAPLLLWFRHAPLPCW